MKIKLRKIVQTWHMPLQIQKFVIKLAVWKSSGWVIVLHVQKKLRRIALKTHGKDLYDLRIQ